VDAVREARRALAADASCVRAHLLLAQLTQQQQKIETALEHYRQVLLIDPAFAGETIAGVRSCAQLLAGTRALADFLGDLAAAQPAPGAPTLALMRLRTALGGMTRAALAAQLVAQPSLDGLVLWMEQAARESPVGADVADVATALQKRLASRPRYQCRHCGFTTSVLFWQCPSCKTWGTVKPAESAV
jgi:lipopolysaccharide biosynthesis regulator YciM